MKNQYVDCPDGTTRIRINTRSGDINWATISTIKLPLADSITGTWCLLKKLDGTYYIYAKDYSAQTVGQKGGGRNIYLHRVVRGLTDGDPREANHVDWDGLNCVDRNLEILTSAQNKEHRHLRSTLSSNNTSGLRNVHLHKGSYEVIVGSKYIGRSKDLAVAGRMAAKARSQYSAQKYSAGVARQAARTTTIPTAKTKKVA